jgi:cellulose synthase/poly-beta-1,6-N-acetylglucosamine synthase-like glycosyltransferase
MIALAVLYAVAMVVLLAFGLNQLWLAYRYARADRLRPGPVPAPDTPPEAMPPGDGRGWPSVTVQLPLYNERYVAARLIDACVRLEYPADRIEFQILDDSTDETHAVVAERVAHWRQRGVDVVHVCRTDRTGYKAGALANGLGFARGDLVAIFDADFVPAPDFLLQTVPHFADDGVGLVQARWGHLNTDSLLTVAQSALLDAHFVIEQGVRNEVGCFMNFNGTAGIWRRACIDEAGGWHADTLTEDLDLSYRAQLAGWRFRFLGDLGVPAELPATVAAWRQQQFRWTKGTAETARKMLGRLWRTPPGRRPLGLRVKLEGTFHLTGFVVFPAILAVAVLHAPLLTAHALGYGVSDAFLGVMGLGLFAFAGMTLAHLFAQRALYPRWGRRMLLFPWFLTASMGLALSNTKGGFEALRRRRSPFVRTPKGGDTEAPTYAASASREGRWLGRAEVALALYCAAGLVALVASGEWAAVPFQVMFTAGFAFVCGYDSSRARRRGARLRTLQLSRLWLSSSARQAPPPHA